MCPLAEGAGPLLVQAFSAGGDQAKVAAFVLTRTGVCTNQTANDAALNAFFNAVTKDRENLLRWGGPRGVQGLRASAGL